MASLGAGMVSQVFRRPAQGTQGASNSLIWGRKEEEEREGKTLAFLSNTSASMDFF